MLSVSGLSSDVFSSSKSVTMRPMLAAEWNQNLFNPPHVTVAGDGTKQSISLSSGTIANATGSNIKTNFTTKQFSMSSGSGSVKYAVTASAGSAFKIITYIKTNTRLPLIINTYAKGTSSQFGSSSSEASLFGWTRIETYIGTSSSTETMTSFEYTISAGVFGSADPSGTVYFTEPEVYKTTYFDYQNNSLFPADSAFTYFRPGESYVRVGNSSYTFPSNFRKMNSLPSAYSSLSYNMPVSSIFQNPTHIDATYPFPNMKTVAPSDLNEYKYFVSDSSSKSITAIYEEDILCNKLVLKFNSLAVQPTLTISIDGSNIATGVYPDTNGILVLYWTGSAWTQTPWANASTPKFTNSGSINTVTEFSKITVTQTGIHATRSPFNSYSGDAQTDIQRMHIVEISPRLEVDLSDYVMSVSVSKSLDSKNNYVPISSIESDDARFTLSGIPVLDSYSPVALFSSQRNSGATILSGMLRKNIKFYLNYRVERYTHPTTNAPVSSTAIVPGGIFYSDSWSESDVNTVDIQAFDITRFLQSLPAPDYVSSLKSVFDVITNLLELAGFTDYDYDSLYSVLNDEILPTDISYFFSSAQDMTLIDALSEIFLAYQIGAYIDEYGIMKFLSLAKILEPASSVLSIGNGAIINDGYSVQNKSKIGKISVRYQSPKIRQSLAVQNVQDQSILESASFVYTTANTVVWAQESVDSVGYNFLSGTMSEIDNFFEFEIADLLDPFHTFSLNSSGYAAIEDEIVSLGYKEYEISQNDPLASETFLVKNDLELSSAINRFIKKYQTKFVSTPAATITGASDNGTDIVFTSNNSFSVGQNVMISGVKPSTYNINGTIKARTSSSFTIEFSSGNPQTYVEGGIATAKSGYDITVTPTGKIANVQRGLFGSRVSSHETVVTGDISDKSLIERSLDSSYSISTSSHYSIGDSRISGSIPPNTKVLLFPETERDIVKISSGNDTYGTYSGKLMFGGNTDDITSAVGIFFNFDSDISDASNTHFVELIRFVENDRKRYLLAIYYYDGVNENILAWADITGYVNVIIENFEKVFNEVNNEYQTDIDEVYQIKVVRWNEETNENGENPGQSLAVFLNNVEIHNWQVPAYSDGAIEIGDDWEEMPRNSLTKLPQKINLEVPLDTGSIFGAYTTTKPVSISGISYATSSISQFSGHIREIYATQKPLKDRSVNYYFQDSEFLNSMIQKRNTYTSSKSYIMQVKPHIVGINYYDVQYTTPAATIVDILPTQYLWYYFPGADAADQQYYQKKLVDEYSLSYSSIMNTGFRARFAIANNARHMVFLKHDADQLNQFTNVMTLWTHEIIAPSTAEIVERVVDRANASEVAQIDSMWIQSKESAEKLTYLVSMGIDGFSSDINIEIFGNPLIQIGDIVNLSYPLAGVINKKCLVHSVSHSFDNGLITSLKLNAVG